MKPVKSNKSNFKTFIDTDESKKIAELVLKSRRLDKLEDGANLFVIANKNNLEHSVDSLMYGSMAMYEVQRAALVSLIVQVLIEAAYAIEDADANGGET